MKGKQINLENIPEKEKVETFWKSIWGDSIEFDSQCIWVKKLKQSYCQNVEETVYQISEENINTAIDKIKSGKSPGRDLIV